MELPGEDRAGGLSAAAAEAGQVRRLIEGWAERSGTTALIDDTVARILIERTGRNPRKIKRIINSFVLEYQLDPGRQWAPLGSTQLVTAILLQQLYSPFCDMLVRQNDTDDLISEFLDSADVRERLSRCCGGLGDQEARHALRVKLVNRPLATEQVSASLVVEQELRSVAFSPFFRDKPADFQGLSCVLVDDNPASVAQLAAMLEERGGAVKVYQDSAKALVEVAQLSPDAVVSDIKRGNESEAGFDFVADLRRRGYDRPVELAAEIATAEYSVVDLLRRALKTG